MSGMACPMRDHELSASRGRARWLALLLFALAAPAPALAQYIGAAPRSPAAPYVGFSETPAAALSRNLRLIALNPRDFGALVAAGRAALDLGDHQAAVGFFGRAEEINPNSPAPKIGMGAATVQMGDALGALGLFFQAQQLGASAITLGADRGLAQDLLGNQVAAQNDYRAALGGPDRDEARRRLALSLAISRDPAGATGILQPLLNRRDPGAQRVRAFILALGGDRPGARRAIEAAMPGSAARIDPFFMILPSLSATQKAAAVHLGVFPTATEIKLAAVEPPRIAPSQQQRLSRRVTTNVAPPIARQAPRIARPAPPIARPVPVARPTILPSSPITTVVGSGVASSPFAAPVARSGPLVTSTPALVTPSPAPVELAPTPVVPAPTLVTPTPAPATSDALKPEPITADPTPLAPALAPVISTPALAAVVAPEPELLTIEPAPSPEPPASTAASSSAATVPPASTFADLPAPGFSAPTGLGSGDRLSGIEKLLAETDEAVAPPAPRPKVERPATTAASKASAIKSAANKTAEARKLDAKKAEANKLAEEKKAREAIGVAGSNWVQLAGGANADRMGTEFRKLAAKSSALRKRGGYVTEGKDYFRLLAGPFATKSEAQGFVNQLAKDDVEGFSWTRTPPTIRIEKLPAK